VIRLLRIAPAPVSPQDPDGENVRLEKHWGSIMKQFYWVSLVLLVIGGLNWLLVGLFNFDLVAALFGEMSAMSRVVYVLVGISAIVVLATSFRSTGATDDSGIRLSPR
jgi:uncharacterized membrane protein YuzA (DUF378 family)